MPRQIHPEAIAKALAAGEPVYLLDVREPWEHEHARLADSTLIPLGELPQRLDEVDPPTGAAGGGLLSPRHSQPVGAAILEANGFSETYSLAGGIEAWSTLIDPKVPRY